MYSLLNSLEKPSPDVREKPGGIRLERPCGGERIRGRVGGIPPPLLISIAHVCDTALRETRPKRHIKGWEKLEQSLPNRWEHSVSGIRVQVSRKAGTDRVHRELGSDSVEQLEQKVSKTWTSWILAAENHMHLEGEQTDTTFFFRQ